MPVTFSLKFNDREIALLLENLSKKTLPTMVVGTRASVLFLTRLVMRRRLSFSKAGPPQPHGLRRITGTALRSVAASPRVEATASSVRGTFGSHLAYVRAHELGFSGVVQVRAHTRRKSASLAKLTDRVRASDPTHTLDSARARARSLAKRAPSTGVVYVRAHSARLNMRARHFFRDSLKLGAPGVSFRLRRAIEILVRTGRVPAVTDLKPDAGAIGGL